MFSINGKEFIWKALMSLIGITLISFGAALSQTMNMGLDPFTAINTGASELLGFTLGNYQLFVNAAILAIILFFDRKIIGWGTIFNLVLVGYMIEFFISMLESFIDPTQFAFIVQLLITVVAILIFTFGVALYMDADLGVSPYDAIAPVITDRVSASYKTVRMIQDIVVVITAWILGGPVGVSTFITGFLAGPLIDFFSNRFTNKLSDKVEAKS
ncbi:YczE/YyaS/YitT family protein [Ruoffia tabacinasalis]|uniref:YczE/YyaS/YitT family protein n=1 Tax=Ruoffia tabacinasalis TaxID=87458 RepID=UPI003F9D9EB4